LPYPKCSHDCDDGASSIRHASSRLFNSSIAQALELLQCSGTTVEGLRRAAAACGPLSHAHQWRPGGACESVGLGTAQWRCGVGQCIDDDGSRLALQRVVPAGPRWHRDFVVYCRVTRRVGSAWKRESFGLAGEQHETLVPESRVTLQALRVTPLNAALEVQRLLAND